jgi:hypothetical protein
MGVAFESGCSSLPGYKGSDQNEVRESCIACCVKPGKLMEVTQVAPLNHLGCAQQWLITSQTVLGPVSVLGD